MTHLLQEQYDGPATIRSGDREIEVDVRLRGHFEPIDGRFHWYGRIVAEPMLTETASPGDSVEVRTPHGAAEGRLSDLDLWGRFRITGTGAPPF